MRLASYTTPGQIAGYGVMTDAGIIALHTRIGARYPDLQALIAGDGLAAARAAIAGAMPDVKLADVAFAPPVAAPDKIWCIGVNYAERNAEYKDNSELPQYPSLFVRHAASLVGHGQNLIRPKVSEQLDYEGEIVLVIGRAGRHIRAEDAISHVFGLTLANEGTVRDWLRHGKFNVTQGKNFHQSGSIGPWITTADAVDPVSELDIITRVNGEIRQQDNTRRLMFPFASLIAYLSTFATLLPGDVILTGTPNGAGARFDPPRWLRPGDVIEVESPLLGMLRNVVADEL